MRYFRRLPPGRRARTPPTFGLHALQTSRSGGCRHCSNDTGHLIGHASGTGSMTQVQRRAREIERLKRETGRLAMCGSATVPARRHPTTFSRSSSVSMTEIWPCAATTATSYSTAVPAPPQAGGRRCDLPPAPDTRQLRTSIRRSSKRTFRGQAQGIAQYRARRLCLYLIMTENAMIGALDPNGFRPLLPWQDGRTAHVPALRDPRARHRRRRAGAQHPPGRNRGRG